MADLPTPPAATHPVADTQPAADDIIAEPSAEISSLAAALLDSEAADDPTEAAEAVASVFARVQELAEENEGLRAALGEERTAHLGLLESNRELEWRVRTGATAGADGSGARREWEDMEARLQLLLTENNLLEARERQTAEELRREQTLNAAESAAKLQALGVAKQAAAAADAADAAAREECEASREAAEAAREAEALAAASEAALANQRKELAALRTELKQAYADNAACRREVERLHGAAALAENVASEKLQTAKALKAEVTSELDAAQAQAQQLERRLALALGESAGHASAAERMRSQAEQAQELAHQQLMAAQEAQRKVAAAAARESELEERVASLSNRVKDHADELQRFSVAAQRQAANSVQAHSRAVVEVQEEAKKQAGLAAEREVVLQRVNAVQRVSLERRSRDNEQLQAQLDREVIAHTNAKKALADAASGGDRALREEKLSAEARAEAAEIKQAQLQTELKGCRDDLVRLRAALETKDSELERSEIRGRRAVSQAESDRDATYERLKQRNEAFDAANEDVRAAVTRGRDEVAEVRRIAKAEAEAQREEVERLKAQLKDSHEAAAGLQELLESQRKVAEGYRAEASRSLAKLSQLETTQMPLQRTLASYREQQHAEREALTQQLVQQQTQLQRALTSSLAQQRTESLSDVRMGLDELKEELRESRDQQRDQQLRVQAARQVVLGV